MRLVAVAARVYHSSDTEEQVGGSFLAAVTVAKTSQLGGWIEEHGNRSPEFKGDDVMRGLPGVCRYRNNPNYSLSNKSKSKPMIHDTFGYHSFSNRQLSKEYGPTDRQWNVKRCV
jgi:hypothetical protein